MTEPANKVAMLATCFPGAHNEHVAQTSRGKTILPPGWRFVSATLRDDGTWEVDLASDWKVPCCPEHHPRLDPALRAGYPPQ
jgi:hypothetical protein